MALALLSLLAPVARPRAASNTPWFVEFVTTAALAICLAISEFRERGFIGRMFAVDEQPTKWIVRGLALFAVWSMLSAFWAGSPYLTVHYGLLWVEYILFFIFVRARIAADGSYRFVALTFTLLSAFIGALCVIEYATLPDFKVLEGVIRLRYGAYAELLVAILPALAGFAITAASSKDRLMLLLAAALGWFAVMLSLSKGAFIAGIIGSLFSVGAIIVFSPQYRRRAAIVFTGWLVLTVCVQAGFSLLSPVPATIDYISGKADATRETSLARLFVWKIGARMVADHVILGVGADNFGPAFNPSRAAYRHDHPDRPADEPVSDNLIGRGHNELLQVAAELGIVGLLLFVPPFAMFGWRLLKRFVSDRGTFTPVLWGAMGGMGAFLISSMVSSFSFRIAQNGIAFFIVMAVAVTELRPSKTERSLPDLRAVSIATVFVLAMSLVLLATKGYAEYCVLTGSRERNTEKASALFARAAAIDPAYATAFLQTSGRYYADQDFLSAATELRKAIDGGCGVVLTYSALAASYEKSGDAGASESAFNEALNIFPRSVFLRVRYAKFLEAAGRAAESQVQMDIARQCDRRQADGWYNLLTIGSTRAFYAARENADIAPPAELKPEAAVLEYLDKQPGE